MGQQGSQYSIFIIFAATYADHLKEIIKKKKMYSAEWAYPIKLILLDHSLLSDVSHNQPAIFRPILG